MSMAPPAPTARKRPWFLIVALVISSVFGATGFVEGWSLVTYYRTPDTDLAADARNIDDTQDRALVKARLGDLAAALEQDKTRVFPFAAAELLLGIALFAFSAGAMAGRSGARSVLVQIVAVQAVVVVLMYFMTSHVRVAARELNIVSKTAQQRKTDDPKVVEDVATLSRKVLPAIEAGQLVFRSIVAGLVLIALTRRRSLAYYEPAPEA